jgi:hypothetical protein
MNRFSLLIVALVVVMASPSVAAAQDSTSLPSPLALADVIRIASERRDEIQAARARTRAGEARPAIVSALPDPMISPSLDHLVHAWWLVVVRVPDAAGAAGGVCDVAPSPGARHALTVGASRCRHYFGWCRMTMLTIIAKAVCAGGSTR